MKNSLHYVFTVYGEVFTGELVHEHSFPDHVILIQRTKLRDYITLKERSLETIAKYG